MKDRNLKTNFIQHQVEFKKTDGVICEKLKNRKEKVEKVEKKRVFAFLLFFIFFTGLIFIKSVHFSNKN